MSRGEFNVGREKNAITNLVYFVFGYLSFYAITAFDVQLVTESSPLLEVYNWVLGVMIIVGLITKFICDNFEGYPQWVTWPFKFMFAVSGIMGHLSVTSITNFYLKFSVLTVVDKEFGNNKKGALFKLLFFCYFFATLTSCLSAKALP